MKFTKSLLTTGLFCCLGLQSLAQSFQTTVFKSGIDYNHYSIATNDLGEYICAGTLFHPSGFTDIHVFALDPMGNLMWEKIIDQSDDDRGLDVAIDRDNNIVVTGYTSPSVVGEPELYVVKMDQSGGFMYDLSITDYPASVGTNIIYSPHLDMYVVGGFTSDPLSFPLVANKAYILQLDQTLTLGTQNQLVSGADESTSINDIVEVPSGFLVVGSAVNVSNGVQGCLAVSLDHNLGLIYDFSYRSAGAALVGVSAVYDDDTDEAFIMSNSDFDHNPQITVVSNLTLGPFISSEYVVLVDQFASLNASGFQLKMCSWNPNHLIAAGYHKNFWNGITGNNATPWIVEFERNNGTPVSGYTWPTSAPNFQAHGGGILSTFSNVHPYIFNQEIITERSDNRGFVFIGPREIGSSFGIDIVTTVYMNNVACFDTLIYPSFPNSNPLINVSTELFPGNAYSPNAVLLDYGSNNETFCSELQYYMPLENDTYGFVYESPFYGNSASLTDESQNLESFEVSPNPFMNYFTVRIVGEDLKGQLSVMNALGQIVYVSDKFGGSNYQEIINLEGFEKGIYILKYSDGEQNLLRKMVKL